MGISRFLSIFLLIPLAASAAEFRLAKLKTDCSSSSISVVCLPAEELSKRCAKDAAACGSAGELIVTDKLCLQQKLETKVYALAEINEHLKCGGKQIDLSISDLESGSGEDLAGAMQPLIDRVTNCGVFFHEVFHACAPLKIQSHAALRACNEYGGNIIEGQVLSSALSELCGSGKALRSKARRYACAALCAAAFSVDVSVNWNSCLCNNAAAAFSPFDEWLSDEECCSCRDKCSADSPSNTIVPDLCFAQILTEEEVQQLAGRRANACESINSASSYSCDRMSKGKRRVVC